MNLKCSFVICVLTIIGCQMALTQNTAPGYNYKKPTEFEIVASPQTASKASHFSPRDLFLQTSPQQLHPQQQPSIPRTNSFGANAPFSINPNQQYAFTQQSSQQGNQVQQPSNHGSNVFATHSQNLPFNQNPTNFGSQQSQYYTQQEDTLRLEFHPVNTIQDNNIDGGEVCSPEPIIGQFRPDLVDLNNGGPLSRVITTCGPNQDCKSLALQSDLNRVLTLHPYQIHASGLEQLHIPRPQAPAPQQGQVNNVLPYKRASRRLFEYSEIPVEDSDVEHFN